MIEPLNFWVSLILALCAAGGALLFFWPSDEDGGIDTNWGGAWEDSDV